ncbi:hypothetical protein [Mycobacterium phage Azrael100]|uniref:Uncharacterized protein n=1 Tax=Mycobacterium phage Cosmo TaxID=1567467 RepID=A0A0B5A386_9CAUD|nr:hypothetical protein COSMO_63 [Mycobacterium phage Cosmo]WKR36073.1 hypothetical protein [Mycobacterium phage Azrael100]
MSDEPIYYEWKRRTDGPPWSVRDWQGRWHDFDTEEDQLAFIERDKRMLAAASADARADVVVQMTQAFENQPDVDSGHAEQAVDHTGQAEAQRAGAGRQGNRQSRRRARRLANSKKASGGRR